MSASHNVRDPRSSARAASSKAAIVCGVMLLLWLAAQALVVGHMSRFEAGYAVLGVAMTVWGGLRLGSAGASRLPRLHRLQGAMEGIAETIDPLAIPPTAEQPEGFDGTHAPGHAHRAPATEPPPVSIPERQRRRVGNPPTGPRR